MIAPGASHLAVWLVVALATAGVILRPFRWPEAVWAVGGALVLVASGLLPLRDAASAIGKGFDVYLFLIGMMLLSETARREGLFDQVAAMAVNHARGSPQRLFLLIYAAGTVTTVFLSNDATAVVLTPAVYAAARKARLEPLPYLFICAFIANAASFVLPISNPANIVLYADHTPPLGRWLAAFALPSLVSVLATYAALRLTEGRRLAADCARDIETPGLNGGAKTALAGLALTAVVLIAVSAMDARLGAPTCIMGALTAAAVLIRRRAAPWPMLKAIAWQVLFLVAGLFVLVEALGRAGLIAALSATLRHAAAQSIQATAWASGAILAVGCNLMNNLPAGLIASSSASQAGLPRPIVDALLIGVDLGPNISVTGSLATILWLTAIRREGEDVSFARFLKTGLLVTPPALALALAARLLLPR